MNFCRFIYTRLRMCGWELGAAHFLVARGGKVRLKGSDAWIDNYIKAKLPGRFVEGFHLEAIDLSGMEIVYQGLENLG